MTNEVLYRKWRPQLFSDLAGQELIARTLTNAVSSRKVSHAYLFSGPRGTGKTTMARLLAKAVNCLHDDPAMRPDNECEFCIAVNNQRFLTEFYTAGLTHGSNPAFFHQHILVGDHNLFIHRNNRNGTENRFAVFCIGRRLRDTGKGEKKQEEWKELFHIANVNGDHTKLTIVPADVLLFIQVNQYPATVSLRKTFHHKLRRSFRNPANNDCVTNLP